MVMDFLRAAIKYVLKRRPEKQVTGGSEENLCLVREQVEEQLMEMELQWPRQELKNRRKLPQVENELLTKLQRIETFSSNVVGRVMSVPITNYHALLSPSCLDFDDGTFHQAAERNDVQTLRRLLARGWLVDGREHGKTALHVAAVRGHVDAANALLDEGAHVLASDALMRHPLHLAAAEGHVDMVRLLVEEGAAVNQQDFQGDTPLALAAVRGQTDSVEALLEFGAAPNISNENGQTPLIKAVLAGHMNSVKLLLEKEPEVYIENKLAASLIVAAERGFVDILRLLLKRPVLRRCLEQCLLVACCADVVKVLLGDARLVLNEELREKAVFKAVSDGRVSALECLLKAGFVSRAGFFLAAEKGHLYCLRAFIHARYDPRMELNEETILHIAAERGHSICVQWMLNAGVHHAVKRSEWTPLHSAAKGGATQCARLLIEAGADVHASCKDGTPLQIAFKYKHHDTVRFLEEGWI